MFYRFCHENMLAIFTLLSQKILRTPLNHQRLCGRVYTVIIVIIGTNLTIYRIGNLCQHVFAWRRACCCGADRNEKNSRWWTRVDRLYFFVGARARRRSPRLSYTNGNRTFHHFF
jgi:hypothetical protein